MSNRIGRADRTIAATARDEGFEAEVFSTSGTCAAGHAVLRQAACEGSWDVELVLVDPEAVPTTAP